MFPIRAVLLDFDGVIANTIPMAMRVFRNFLGLHKHTVSEQDLFEAHYHIKSLAQILHHLRDTYGIYMEKDEFIQHLFVLEQAELSQHSLEVDSSLLVLLAYCEAKNITVGIGSNSSRERIKNILRILQIEKFFLGEVSHILSADDLSAHKPDPEVWTRSAHNMDIPIETCLVVEDGLPGILGAKTCGAQSLYYHHFCTPDAVCLEHADGGVSDFFQVVDFIEGRNSCNL